MKILDLLLDYYIASLQQICPIGSWKTCYQSSLLSWDQKRRINRFQQSSTTFRALWHDSLYLFIQPGEEVSECVYTQGFYEPNQFFALKRLLNKGNTFIDIGAHIGLFSIYASKRVGPLGKVYAFEPSPRERERLSEHIKINHLDNITVFPYAISDRNEQAEIKVAEYPHSGHNTIGQFAYSTTRENSRLIIETQTLDYWTKSCKISQIDLIKIDAEGSEEKILAGASETISKHRPFIMIEITSLSLQHQNSSIEAIWKKLTDLGYILLAYHSETGLPYRVSCHPGINHTDFLAVPSEKINKINLEK